MSPFEALVLIREAQQRYSSGGNMGAWFKIFATVISGGADLPEKIDLIRLEDKETRVDEEYSNTELTYAAMLQNIICTGLKMGEVFIARPNMCQLMDGIWSSMPEQSLLRSDLPAESGILFFDQPISLSNEHPPISGVTWCAASLRHNPNAKYPQVHELDKDSGNLELGSGMWLAFFVDTKSPGVVEHVVSRRGSTVSQAKSWLNSCPRILLYDIRMYRFGEAPCQYNETAFGMVSERSPMAARMQAFFALCKQELPAIERYDPTAKELKLMRRMDLRTRVISVIMLRRRSGQGHRDTEVEWSHRWLVRGHWRNQWYSSEQTHRLIYINPHIKGPEDKPLVIHDKVNILGR